MFRPGRDVDPAGNRGDQITLAHRGSALDTHPCCHLLELGELQVCQGAGTGFGHGMPSLTQETGGTEKCPAGEVSSQSAHFTVVKETATDAVQLTAEIVTRNLSFSPAGVTERGSRRFRGVAVELCAQAHAQPRIPFTSSTLTKQHDQVSTGAITGPGLHPQDFIEIVVPAPRG